MNIKELIAKAEAGDAQAQCKLGAFYFNGEGVAQDLKKSEYWYLKAAEQGDANAQFSLGDHYFEGDFIQDDSLAVFWWKKAANQNHADALYNLGYCYWDGYGVEQNVETAKQLWLKAKALGHEVAAYNLKERFDL